MRRWSIAAVLVVVLAGAMARAGEAAAARWVYVPVNMLVDKNVEQTIELLGRASAAGYNGILLTDSKFMRWDDLPEKYAQNVRRVRQACRERKLACIAAVCSIGYSNDLLSRDPNLAEGLPVVDAPFIARGGKLVPASDGVEIRNGGFETGQNNKPEGWSFVDGPGKISFLDEQVKSEGQRSLRLQDMGVHNAPHGNGRASMVLAIKPFRAYHVSLMLRTQDFEKPGNIHFTILGKDGQSLNHAEPKVERTQDWKRYDFTFNTLENSEVRLYVGVWGGKGGAMWLDDVKIEPAGFVNLVRREGAPLRIKLADGTALEEGRDLPRIVDPKMGVIPWPGEYTVWHEQPEVAIPAGSRIRDGQQVLASYYHTATIYHGQVGCCLGEERLFEIVAWQVDRVKKNVDPDGYMMSHDEIRMGGWDESCRKNGRSPAQLLAENVKRCAGIIRKTDPGKPIYAWSDMFDPHHNAAKEGKYYLVKGDGPWYGSWEGLDPDITILNWNSDPAKRKDSLQHFAARGHRQILAGYYDGDVKSITPWLKDVPAAAGAVGVMYTTWAQNYKDLEAFSKELDEGGYIFRTNERKPEEMAAARAKVPAVDVALPPDRLQRLPQTMKRLRDGQTLSIVMLGDSIINDTARSAWHERVASRYPGATIVRTVAVRGGTGCWWYQHAGRINPFVLAHKPDLVIVGGISQRSDVGAIRECIRQIRAGSSCEIFLMTGPYGSANPLSGDNWRSPAEAKYAAELKALADELGTEYFDLQGAWAEYVQKAGKPLDSFKRDPVHANPEGEALLANILDAYFAPKK